MKNKSELEAIPGVGKSIAKDLNDLNIFKIEHLKGEDAEDLYNKLMKLHGVYIDRCMLYVFRCAIYFASNKTHDPELLKWWNWKDKNNSKNKFQGIGICGIEN